MDKGDRFPNASADRHRRRLRNLICRLPCRLRSATLWLLRPQSRWARIPAGAALILGGFLSILPVFGLWMFPLGFILLAEDLPIVRRGVMRVLDWLESRRPHWFSAPDAD
jgi:hypothetical protein